MLSRDDYGFFFSGEAMDMPNERLVFYNICHPYNHKADEQNSKALPVDTI